MLKHLRTMSCVLISALAAPAVAQEAETVNKSLVRVIAFKNGQPAMTATGFAIGDKGFVVTSDLVVWAGELRVLRDGEASEAAQARPAKVVFTNRRRNLAIIEVPGLGAPGLPLATAEAKEGMRVVLFGYKDGGALNSSSSAGLVQRHLTQALGSEKVTFLQHETSSALGTGGPLVDACGAVVAVNGYARQDGASLAVHAADVAIAARASKVVWTAAPPCKR